MPGEKLLLCTSLRLLYSRILVLFTVTCQSIRLKPASLWKILPFRVWMLPNILKAHCLLSLCDHSLSSTLYYNKSLSWNCNQFFTFQETYTCKSLLLLEKLDTICKVSQACSIEEGYFIVFHKALTFYCRNSGSKLIYFELFIVLWHYRIIRLRFQSMCKEYHRHKLAKQSFHHWKVRLMNRQADRTYRGGLQRWTVFMIFFVWSSSSITLSPSTIDL